MDEIKGIARVSSVASPSVRNRIPRGPRIAWTYTTILPVRPAHLILLANEQTRLAAVLPARELVAALGTGSGRS